MSLKILFMGTPKFSVPTLEALVNNNFEILSIYTQPPKKSNRGQKIKVSPVQKFSEKNNLPVRNPKNLSNDAWILINPNLVIFKKFFGIICP